MAARSVRIGQLLLVAAVGTTFGAAAFLYQGIAAERPSFEVLLASVAFYSLSLALGSATIALVDPVRRDVDATEALVTGALLVAATWMALAFVLPMSITENAILVAVVTALAYGARMWRASRVLVLDRSGSMAIATMLVASGLWSFENLRGLVPVPAGFTSYPWLDVFFHAQRIALFARAAGPQTLGDPVLAGAPLPPYHYASYLPAAFVSAATGVDAYSLAASVLPTLGTQLAGLAAYVLGKACFGPIGGLLGALGVLLVPDPSFLHLSSRYTSYHFYQQVGPGGSYAVAAMGLAWVWAYRAVENRRVRYMIAAIVACGLVGSFKIQIALAFAPGLLLFAGWALRTMARRVAWVAGVVSLYVAAGVTAQFVRNAPTLEFSTAGLHEILVLLGSRFPAEHARWWLALVPPGSSYVREALVGVPLVLFSIYAAWLLGVALLAATRPHVTRASACLPAIAVASHLVVLTAIAPNRGPHGDPFEVILKTLVWPYFMVSVWVSAAFAEFVSRPPRWVSRRVRLVAISGGLATAFVVAAWCGREVQWGLAENPEHASHSFMRTYLPSGFVAAARYVRSHAAPQDVVQWSYNDEVLAFGALSERAMYFARPMINTGPITPEGERRVREFRELWNAPSMMAVLDGARRLGIAWLVVSDERRAPWENDPASSPSFVADGYRIYRTGPHVTDGGRADVQPHG